MRRPLCVFCAGALAVGIFCAFLPQGAFLLPFAAIFILLLVPARVLKPAAALCLLLGAGVGLALLGATQHGIRRLQDRYAGRELYLTAQVQQVQPGFYPGVVRAVLWVEAADGQQAGFRVQCPSLPVCAAGDRVSGRFALEAPDEAQALEQYADGAALCAVYQSGFRPRGRSQSFRARTARLQQRLSRCLQKLLDPDTGGVLAAVIVGDRTALPADLNAAYRAAGLSHVLVVSGMHVTLLCGGAALGRTQKRERSYRSRRAAALGRSLCALLLVGITGFTPSVLRAAAAIWISGLGVWVYGPPDALTSLAAAGLLMSLHNGYAACDVGFQLSFAAVLGTLAGAACAQRGRQSVCQKQRPPLPRWLRRCLASLWEGFCVSLGASAATFPVLVLRGMSASAYALVSSLAVLWLVPPLMLLGIAAAVTGLFPLLRPVYYACSFCAGGLAALLNAWVLWVSRWPGARLYFDTGYAAAVCLVLLGLAWLAFRWKLRLRIALPALALLAGVALGLGSALSRDLIHVELAGGANTPAVVISRSGQAVVLFRGGDTAQNAVEALLQRRDAQVQLLVDLRMDPKTPCTLPARRRLLVAQWPALHSRTDFCGAATVETLRTRHGCVVRVTAGGSALAAVSGDAALAKPILADWLLASPADPASLRFQGVVSLADAYPWQQGRIFPTARSLSIRPGGGVRPRLP